MDASHALVGLVFLFSWSDSPQSSLTRLLLARQWEEFPEGFWPASPLPSGSRGGNWTTLLTLYAAATSAIMGNEKGVTQ